MPSVREVLADKGPQVFSIGPGATVLEAVNKMNEHKVGSLVVMDGEHVAGIFTERDVLRRVVGEEIPPAETTVDQVMTSDVVCCGPQAQLDEVGAIMKNRRIRHVPVCGDTGNLIGLISIGDLNAYNASNQEATIHFLNDYIFGRS